MLHPSRKSMHAMALCVCGTLIFSVFAGAAATAQSPVQSAPQASPQALTKTMSPASNRQAPCRQVMHEDNGYTVCEVDLRRQAVRLFWKGSDGQPYGYLGSLPQSLPKGANAKPGRLMFATNGGMYHPDYRPVGLYIENGQELVKASTTNGPGNFHLKPNGIFYVSGDTAGVSDTATFLKARPKTDFATQSGPMLVISGKLHPKFSNSGQSRKLRNGVGVRDANTAIFAISEGEVSFGEFARLFRDELKCANALYLDGSVSSLYAPALQRGGNIWPLGPMIGVFDRGR